jgi:methyl-accepting chemotaxis protein
MTQFSLSQSPLVARPRGGFSVGSRLLLAFGLVAALAMAVAATGFQAIHALLARQQLMADMAQINSLVLQARNAEQDYAATRQAESAERLRQAISDIDELLQGLQQRKALSAVQWQNMASSSQAYLKQFADFDTQLIAADRARTRLQVRAAETMQRFELVELDIYDLMRELLAEPQGSASSPLALAASSGELMRQMQAVRASEWQYLLHGSDKLQGEWQQRAAALDTPLHDLGSRLPAMQQAILGEAAKAFEAYRTTFAEYRRSLLASRTSSQLMRAQAQQLLDSAERASQSLIAMQSAERHRVQLWLAAISALVLLISLVAAWLIRRQIVTPLKEALLHAQRISQGDLRTRPVSRRADEFGQLLSAMQHMGDSLRELVTGIGGGVQQLGDAASALTSLSEQTRAGVRRQHQETEQTAAAMQEMAASVQEVAGSSELASLSTRQVEQDALSGSREMQQTATQVARVADNMEGSAQAVEQLHEASRHIDSVLEVINDIAEQTNLLALNAAIEAARAGEQGRGFAVVADEVRALARRTQESTAQIERLIGGLQQGAQQAVTQIQTSRALTRDSVAFSERALGSLQRITQAIGEIERGSQQTAAATQQQRAVAEMISQSITAVRDIAEQSAGATERMASASAGLADLGQQLQALVQRFRV